MIRKVSLILLLGVLSDATLLAQEIDGNSKEYSFFRSRFERINGNRGKDLNETFKAVSDGIKQIQLSAPRVTLGGMLSLVLFESGGRLAFFNTKDSENSFNPVLQIPNVPKLESGMPFSQQPLARYSYQFGIVPIHTSIFRPCLAGTQRARKLFDSLAKQQGFQPSVDQLASVKEEFNQVCTKARRPVADEARAVDYYILNAHSKFGVPINRAGGDVTHLDQFPLYWPRVTTAFFFAAILARANQTTDDRSAICIWGGGDKSYCNEAKQSQILAPWKKFAGQQSAVAGALHPYLCESVLHGKLKYARTAPHGKLSPGSTRRGPASTFPQK